MTICKYEGYFLFSSPGSLVRIFNHRLKQMFVSKYLNGFNKKVQNLNND